MYPSALPYGHAPYYGGVLIGGLSLATTLIHFFCNIDTCSARIQQDYVLTRFGDARHAIKVNAKSKNFQHSVDRPNIASLQEAI